jgi:hypothetical protein
MKKYEPCENCAAEFMRCTYCGVSGRINETVDIFHVMRCLQCGASDDEPCPVMVSNSQEQEDAMRRDIKLRNDIMRKEQKDH